MKAFVQKIAPAFKGMSWVYNKKSFEQIKLDDYKSKYLLLFFYPLNFTFVCPTQIIQFSSKAKQFNKIGCNVVGCSVDSHYSHMQYTMKKRSQGGLGQIDFPLLSDISKQISTDYGTILQSGISLRGTFIIDPNQIIRHISINDLSVGRNVDEYLRLVQAFKYSDQHGQVCPASWSKGKPTMHANPQSQVTKKYWKQVHDKK